jgi:hypothetical protein
MSLRRIMSLYSRSKKQGGALLRSSGTADLKLPLCSHRETLIGANEGINAASSTKFHYDHLNCTFVRLYVYWGKATGTRGTTPRSRPPAGTDSARQKISTRFGISQTVGQVENRPSTRAFATDSAFSITNNHAENALQSSLRVRATWPPVDFTAASESGHTIYTIYATIDFAGNLPRAHWTPTVYHSKN